MYACGVTIAGLMNRRKKKPPINEHILASDASGCFLYFDQISKAPPRHFYFAARWLTLVKLLICLQIHLIPYGTDSILSIIVARNELAISMSIVIRGMMIAWTSGLAAAISGATPRGREGGRDPVSSSICRII